LQTAANAFRFAGKILKSPDREIQQAKPLEKDVPLHMIKSYLWWRVKYGKGRIERKAITVQTLRKEFQQIARQIARQTDKIWSAKELADIREVIS
jgi:predicted restriction endonuclease